MQRIKRDLGRRLEWVSASHFNTDNPHVHIARKPNRGATSFTRFAEVRVPREANSVFPGAVSIRQCWRLQTELDRKPLAGFSVLIVPWRD